MNEWELMEVAEGIEEGDTLTVEDDSGEVDLMVFVKREGRFLLLKDIDSKEFFFSALNLEEHRGYRYITGKSDEEIQIESE